jgi:hypothetical protein
MQAPITVDPQTAADAALGQRIRELCSLGIPIYIPPPADESEPIVILALDEFIENLDPESYYPAGSFHPHQD